MLLWVLRTFSTESKPPESVKISIESKTSTGCCKIVLDL